MQIGVIGTARANEDERARAVKVGELIVRAGAVLICGGLGGVIEAASLGARKVGSTIVGIIPGYEKRDANPYVDIVVATGMGHARNTIVAAISDALIAIGGETGTLLEIALALKLGKKVIGLETWDIPGVIKARTPEEAVKILTVTLNILTIPKRG